MTRGAPPPPPRAIEAYLAGLAPDAPIVPAMISNPMAARNWRTVAHQRLAERMPDPHACISTPSVADLPRAVSWLLFDKRANVVVINGGDGSIHHGVNAVIAAVDAAAARIGRPVPLPSFLFVNGGGMNMLARVFETRGHPVRTLERFLERTRSRSYGAVEHVEVPLLHVGEPTGQGRYGFIFGSELVMNALTMYERFGRGYRGLARFLWAVGSGYALRTELWARFGHLLDAPTTPLRVDGTTHPRYTCIVCTTVPMLLLKGLVGTVRGTARPGTLHTVAVLETDKGRVIASIPRLIFGQPGPGLAYANDVRNVRLQGPYTIDGERVGPPLVTAKDVLHVAGTTRTVRGVWLGDAKD